MSVTVAAPPSPYKGLAPFEDSDLDALLFFGREHESDVIAANLMASRVTVLYGPSGVGKSSVLRAGVAHRLRQEREAAVMVFSAWTGNPVAGLIDAAGGSGDSLADALADAADRAGGDLYVILDQFEELFLYHDRGGRFASELALVLRRGGLRVNLLVGMREDALARLDVLKASIPNLLSNRLRLERLDRLEGALAITGPIKRYNELVPADERVEIEPQLEQAILDEVTAGRVELGSAGRGVALAAREQNRIEAPYLQLVLARLWDVEQAGGSRLLRLATLRELGGAEHIVEDHLERAMAELSPGEKGAAAAMYHFLVTPSGTKIAHGVSDLAGYAAVDEREAADVLRLLTAERIVRASSENGPSTTRYEIFHDVLADAVVAWRTRYEAERTLAGERVEHRRRQRRLFAIFVAALIAFAVMAAIAVYALAQRSEAQHQADVANAQRIAAVQAGNEAKQQKHVADHANQVAQQKTKDATTATKQAQQSQAEAQQSADNAQVAKLNALAQKARAEGKERDARSFARLAVLARRRADKQRARAERATSQATSQKQVVRAEQLEAEARAFLAEDPERSVRKSLAAVQAYSRTRIQRPIGVEETLRQGLASLRLRAVVEGGGPVHVARFSPSGDLLFIGGKGGARLYDARQRQHLATNKLTTRKLLPSFDVRDAAFSPDGTKIVAAEWNGDRAAHVWDVRTGMEILTLRHEASVLSVAFSPDGQLIATGSADGTARLWTVAGGLQTASWTHQPATRGDDVVSVSFSPDGRHLLTVGGNKFARVFDVARRTELFPGGLNNTALVNVARFSHDGRWIATAGADEFVRLWDARNGKPGPILEGTGRINDLAFSPDDTLLGTAGSNDTIARVWNIAQKSSVAIITAHRSGVQSITFTPDSRGVVTTGRDGKAYISGASAGLRIGTLGGHRASVDGATVSPDGSLVATWSADGTARLWDGRLATELPELGKHAASPAGVAGPVVAFSPNNRYMASGAADGSVLLWGPRGRSVVLHHNAAVKSVSFSRNSARVISAGDDKTARIWRASDGALLATLRADAVISVARLTPDGRRAVTAGPDGLLRVWNVATRRVVRQYDLGAALNDAELSPNGRRVIVAGANRVAAVLGVNGDSRVALRGHSGDVLTAAFSPNGLFAASGSADSTARVWDLRHGTAKELDGHTGDITALAFSPDGSFLATASTDTAIRVWRATSGAQVALLQIHSGAVTDVAFSADGRWLASAGPLAIGLWETRKTGVWPTDPLDVIRGPAPPRLDHLAFSPKGWRILSGWRNGSVRLYDCRLCGGVPQLRVIAKARLAEIVRAKT